MITNLLHYRQFDFDCCLFADRKQKACHRHRIIQLQLSLSFGTLRVLSNSNTQTTINGLDSKRSRSTLEQNGWLGWQTELIERLMCEISFEFASDLPKGLIVNGETHNYEQEAGGGGSLDELTLAWWRLPSNLNKLLDRPANLKEESLASEEIDGNWWMRADS